MKKIASVIIVAAMLTMLFAAVVPASAETTAVVWDGKAGTAMPSGYGTELDPYVIKTPNELDYIATAVLGGETFTGMYFRLDIDVDWGGRYFTPIGSTKTNSFQGIFDGNGKTIYNLKVEDVVAGVFGVIVDATVKNLKVDYATFTTDTRYAGAVVAEMFTSNVSSCVGGENVLVQTSNIMTETAQMGGLFGLVNSSTVSGCAFYGKVNATNVKSTSFVGGIAGVIGNEATVSTCTNFGDVTVAACNVAGGNVYVGGVAGGIGSSSKIGTLEACANLGKVEGKEFVGGVLGRVHVADSVLKDCVSLGELSGGEGKTGAVIGAASKTGVASGNLGLSTSAPVACADFGTNAFDNTMVALAGDTEIRISNQFDKAEDAVKALPSFATVTPSEPAQDTTTEATTTEAPVVDTTTEDVTDATTEPVESTTKAPDDVTDAPTEPIETTTAAPSTEKPSEGGCGGFAVLALVAVLAPAAAVLCIVARKK